MKEGDLTKISIKGVSGDILQQLIESCYTGKVAIDSKNVEKKMKAAKMMQFTMVHRHCTMFHTNILNASNCPKIRDNADEHKLEQLREQAHAFLLDYFIEVSTWRQFLKLSVEWLLDLLKDDGINIASKEDVFTAILDSVKHDVATRTELLLGLFDCVRFQHIKDPVSMHSLLILHDLRIFKPQLIRALNLALVGGG